MDSKEFAILKHKDQTYDDKPYVFHLDSVFHLSQDFFGDKFKELAYLHDVYEDTDVSVDELKYYFGKEITESVLLISDVKEGKNRKERKYLTNKKLSSLSEDIKVEYAVLIIKPIDRYVNMLYSFEKQDKKKIKMYVKEYQDFRSACFRQDVFQEIWVKLDDLYSRMLLGEK